MGRLEGQKQLSPASPLKDIKCLCCLMRWRWSGLMMTMVFQGLRHPAPFSDDLEPANKPYKRVSMDEAKRGTSREWDFQNISPNTQDSPWPPGTDCGFFFLVNSYVSIVAFWKKCHNYNETISLVWLHIKETRREKTTRNPPTMAAFLSFVTSSTHSLRRRLHCRRTGCLWETLSCLPAHARELAQYGIYAAFHGLKLGNRQNQNWNCNKQELN